MEAIISEHVIEQDPGHEGSFAGSIAGSIAASFAATYAAPCAAAAGAADEGFAAQPIASAEIQAALKQLLSSTVFAKARRMRRLLQFLVERHMACSAQSFKEALIGIEVFDRDPAQYDPAEDPIVRVQMGRLRQRLACYYAQQGGAASVIFSVPLGSYIPEIARATRPAAPAAAPASARQMLSIGPVQPITPDAQARCFSLGLSEELYDRMHHQFGSRVVQQSVSGAGSAHAPRDTHVQYRLEGSVRVENDLTRASFRLLDLSDGRITWSRQFDRHAAATLLLQEQLALAVCAELQAHLSSHQAPAP